MEDANPVNRSINERSLCNMEIKTTSNRKRMMLLVAFVDLIMVAVAATNTSRDPSRPAGNSTTLIRSYNVTGKLQLLVKPERKESTSGWRKGRSEARLAADDTDDTSTSTSEQTLDEEPQQVGIAEAKRASRNVKRKMNLLDGRLEQIESLIADDHRANSTTELQPTESDSGESAGQFAANDRLDMPVSSAPTSVVHNLETPPQTDADDQLESSVTRQLARQSNDSSVRWSSPIIKSFIPTRQNPGPSQTDNEVSSSSDGTRSDNDEQPTDENQQMDEQADSSTNNKASNEAEQTASSRHYAVQEQSTLPYDTQRINPVSGFNQTNYLNAAADSAQPSSVSSMLNSQWSPNQNYNYFSELNAKNHGGSSQNRALDSSGPVAFRTSSSPARSKFQNMSTDSEIYQASTQQNYSPQLARLSTTSTTTSTKRPEARKSSVYTYSASHYGKSSKDKHQPRADVTKQSDVSVDSTSYERSDAIRNHNDSPIQWPQFPTSYASNQNVNQVDTNQPAMSSDFINRYSPILQSTGQEPLPVSMDLAQTNKDAFNNVEDRRYSNQMAATDQANNINHNLASTQDSHLYARRESSPDNYNQHQFRYMRDNWFNNTADLKRSASDDQQSRSYSVIPNSEQATPQSDSMSTFYNDASVATYQTPDLTSSSRTRSNSHPSPTIDRNHYLLSGGPQDLSTSLMETNVPAYNYQFSGQSGKTQDMEVATRVGNEVDTVLASQQQRSRYHQDSMQPSATNIQNHLTRQQQLSQLAADLLSQNPALNNVDINALLLQRYQQKQRQLAAQLQLQQQQSAASEVSAASLPSYTSSRAGSHSVHRRYSPDSLYNYLTRSTPVAQSSTSEASEVVPYSSHYPTVQGGSLMNERAMRAANLAYYRAALAANGRAQMEPQPMGLIGMTVPAYLNQAHQQQAATTSTNSAPIYASTMNNPNFYEASSEPKSSVVDTSSGSTGSDSSRQQYSSVPYKRNYLNSLFKPSASSRYYYAPTLLSPISLATPAAIHPIYDPNNFAPAAAAADNLQSMQQIYAASPYMIPGQQMAQAPIDQSQQYQAYATSNGHYGMDAEMAESSLVPTDTANYAEPNQSSSSSSSSSEQDNNAASSSSKSSKSLTPWTNIAGLLLGILPFGILMASLIPAVSVTGRRKRQLDVVGVRNFSDLLKWRAPSQVLDALIGQQESGLANASAIINDQLAGFMNPTRLNRAQSLLGGRIQSQDNKLTDIDSTSTTLNSPMPTTTPMPSGSSSNSSTKIKARVRKAFDTLNNMVMAAQNIKRKHRSSILESQWSLPNMIKNTFKWDSLFNTTEYKRQLAQLVQRRVLLAQQQLFQKQQQQLASKAPATTLNGEKRSESAELNVAEQIEQSMNNSQADRSTKTTSKPTKEHIASQHVALREIVLPTNNIDDSSLILTRPEPPKNLNLSAQFKPVTIETASHSIKPIQQHPQGNISVTNTNNSTKYHLELCLNQFLCRLTVKLNKSLKSALSESSHNGLSNSEQQVEKITKKYINQLVEQIEAQHPSVSLGSKISDEDSLDALYKNALKNQCSLMYNCVELIQLEKTLSKMKLKFN